MKIKKIKHVKPAPVKITYVAPPRPAKEFYGSYLVLTDKSQRPDVVAKQPGPPKQTGRA